MKKYLQHIQFLLLIVLIGFLYGFAANRNSERKNSDVKIVFKNGGSLFVSYETVNKLLIQNLGPLENQAKENINLNNAEQFVEKNQMIENAEIYQTINGELGVVITQRTPVLRVSNDLGSCYYDKHGEKMPLSENFSARIPLTTSKLDKENCKDIICLANKIKNDDFLKKQIIGINQIEGLKSNQFELKTRVGDQVIIFGDLQRMESKIKNLKVFYQKIMSDGTLNNYKTINLKFNNQVVCAKF
ncbi:MAG: hypothetical protein OEM04_09630 [Flavobacteriaceae bacterium]|nr:hypothetical protein [Flavobacteriaceae bacterium]